MTAAPPTVQSKSQKQGVNVSVNPPIRNEDAKQLMNISFAKEKENIYGKSFDLFQICCFMS